MEKQSQNLSNDESAILSSLQSSLQNEIGRGLKLSHLSEISPILTVVSLTEPASGNRYSARIYRAPPSAHSKVQSLWREHTTGLHAAFKLLPQKAQGLKQLGNALAYIAADVPGLDLASYLNLCGPTRPEFAVRTCVYLIRTLEKLHELGCHHYQINPGNVTITPEGKPVLKWIGLAGFERALASSLEVSELFDATYAAPEVLAGAEPTPATDIYQLGLLLFRMVAGRAPFQGTPEQLKEGHRSKSLPNPQALNKAVNVGFNQVLIRALAKNPAQRFASLTKFKMALAYLQNALERAETTGAAKSRGGKPKEQAQVTTLLKEAQSLFAKGDLQPSLRVVDNIFMLTGFNREAARLHQQIWEAIHGPAARKKGLLACELMEKGNTAAALTALNSALGMAPHYRAALGMQAKIFASLGKSKPALPLSIDAKAFLGKAVEIKANNPNLAEGLWSQVLLIPQAEDEPARSELQFQKQLAVRGLKGLHNERAAESEVEITSLTPAAIVATSLHTNEEPGVGDDFDDIYDAEHDASTPPDQPDSPSVESAESAESAEFDPEPSPEHVQLNEPTMPLPQGRFQNKWRRLIGVATVLVFLVGAGLFLKIRADSATRAAANLAYAAADNAENEGKWDVALEHWKALVSEYPNFRNSKKRLEDLEVQVKRQRYEIADRIDRAKALLEAGLIHDPDDKGKNALQLLSEAIRMEPSQPEASQLIDQIRALELDRAWELFKAEKRAESQAVYSQLLTFNPSFRDPELEAKLSDWTKSEIVVPGLVRLDKALKRKRWGQAREISDELSVVLSDQAPLRQRWARIFNTYEEAYESAKKRKKPQAELAALSVMVIVRPDDLVLLKQRDKLNHDLNLEQITKLEQNLGKARVNGVQSKIISGANKLLKLDSGNKSAKAALTSLRKEITSKIKVKKATDSRAALKLYNDLFRVSNWKTYREAKEALQARVHQFDAGLGKLKVNDGQPYSKSHARIAEFLAQYPDFGEDAQFKTLLKTSEQMAEEEVRLNTLIKWESKAAGNMGQRYSSILSHIHNQPAFKFRHGKKRIKEFIKKYQDKIENYDGPVTIVIRSAKNLPSKKGSIKRQPTSFCELKAGGQTFRTERIKGQSASWNHACNIKAGRDSGVLVFTVFEQSRKQSNPIGAATLPKIPKDTKNLLLKPSSGNWTLSIDVRRGR